MKKNKAHLVKALVMGALLLAGTSNGIYAQKDGGQIMPNRCGTQVPDAQWEAWMQEKVNELTQQRLMQGNNSTEVINYTIPVIFHILHNQASVTAENISAAQVNSQITILNNDYAGTNADAANIPSTFQSVKAGNIGITFCLAKTDPTGTLLAEAGIERINWSSRGWTDPNSFTSAGTLQSYFDGTVKPNSIWDPTKYLNIWVAKVNGSGLLGYASFPAGTGLTGLTGVETATTCGVVLNQSAVGNTGTAAAPYNGGRTATHEIGHWLGLRHIWGDGTCATDYCNDTPSAETANYNCQTHPYNTASAGGCAGNTTGEMFMNYMDYVPDACMYMFTLNQATRIQTAMANGTYRVGLNTSGKCNNPVALDAGIASIIAPVAGSSGCNNSVTPKVVLTNAGTTTLTSATITYNMDGGTNQVYNWTGSLTTGSTATVTLNAYTGLSVATHTFSATTSSPNGGADGFAGNNNMTATFTVTSSTGTGLPFTEGFQNATFVPTGWTYTAPNAPYSWARVTTAGGFGTSTASAMMDNYSSATSIVGQKDALRTPLLTFAAANSTLNLKFDVAYAAYNATLFDSLNVWISTDCGSTWTRVYNKGNTALSTATTTTVSFVPTAAQWRTETVSLSSYAGQSSVYLKFESVSGWGNNLYLDNINISYTASAIPTANFTTSATKCAGQPITFTDASTNTPTSWNWSTNPSTGVTISTATSQNPTITFATAGTYTVTHTATNGSGTSPSYTQAIVVNATPAMTSASTANVCSGSAAALALTSSVASGYSWIAAANANVSGESTTAQTTTTINNTLTITSGTTNQTVTYSVTPTATTGGCVGATQTVSVTVIPLPTVSNATTANGCSGSALNIPLTASAPSSFSWIAAANANVSGESTTAQATSTINNTVTITTGTVTQNVTYSITPTSTTGGCVGPVKTMTVTINPLPAMTSGTSTNICSGVAMNFALTSNIASTYSWLTADNANTTGESTTAQTNSSINNTITSTAATNQTLNYSVTPTSSAGCAGAVQTVTVTVRPTPAMTNASAASICSGTAVGLALTSNVASSYSWIAASNTNVSGESTTAQATSTINNTLTVTSGTSAQTVTYSVTPTSTTGGCLGAVQTVSVTVTPAPAMTSVNTATVCSGSVVNIPLTASVPSSFSWIAANNANTSGESTTAQASSAISNTLTITSGGNQTVTYSVTPTSTAGSCLGTVQTVTVTVRALPAVTASSTPPSGVVCAGSQITLSGGGATTYTWTGGASNGVAFTPASSGTYTVTGTDANGCTNTATKAVTVNSLPTVTASSTPASGAVCTGSQITLTGGGATTYTWTGGASNGVAFTPASSGTYTVTGTDANGCTNTATKAVTVNSLPTVTVNSPSTCSGSPVTLIAAGATTYTWSTSATGSSTSVSPTTNTSYTVTGTDANGCVNTAVSNVTITSAPNVTANSVTICAGQQAVLTGSGASTYSWSTGDATATTTVTPTGTTSYTVTGSNGPGCTNTAIATVTVNSLPTVTAVGSGPVCAGTSATLTASGANTYSWSEGSTGSIVTVTPTTTMVYTVTGTDGNNCTNTATVPVTVNPAITALNVTPANSSCGNSNGSVTISGTTGGTAPYVYAINGGSFSGTTIYTGLAAGSYTLDVEDANGCSFSTTAAIGNTGGPTAQVVTPSNSTCGNANGIITFATTSGGTAPYTYSIDGTTFSPANSYTVTAGTYTCTVQDVNGCQFITTTTVNNTAAMVPTVSQAGVTLTSSSAVSYQWYFNGNPITGETNQTLNVTQNGPYTVETVDANGCTAMSATFNVNNIGIKDAVLNASIAIFPNPNEGNFTVKGTADPGSEYTLELRNTLGQLIQSETIKNTSSINRTFSLKANDAGVYFIIIRNNEGASSVHRVIVQ